MTHYSDFDYTRDKRRWRKLSAHIRFVRAGNRCEWCDAANHQPHPETGGMVALTVAHINHDTADNRFSNLAALCNRCHLAHDKDLHIQRARQTRRRKRRAQGHVMLPGFRELP